MGNSGIRHFSAVVLVAVVVTAIYHMGWAHYHAAACTKRSSRQSAIAKLTAALFYGVASLLIMFVNKFALTVYSFPSFTYLAFAQCVATVVVIRVMKAAGVVQFPDFDRSVIRKLFPLPIFFMLNVLSGLGGTKRINVRACVAPLRRGRVGCF